MKKKILNTKLLPGQIALFYLGQVGYIIKYNEKYIMIDGYFAGINKWEAKPEDMWVRSFPAPIAPEELDFVDYIFCSHDHSDHADPVSLPKFAQAAPKATFYASAAFTDSLVAYGVPADRIVPLHAALSDSKPVTLCDGITVTPIPSAHEQLHQDENGDFDALGFKFAFGDITLYHGGDGCPYAELEAAVAGSDILMLPINGRDFYRTQTQNIIGNFDCREAAVFAKHVGAKLLIPTHFDMFSIDGINPAHFVDILNFHNPTQSFHIFRPGEKYIYDGML